MIVPARVPQWPEAKVREVATLKWSQTYPDQPLPPVIFLGIRGYYRDSMGVPGKNDRGIYDDAMYILTPTVCAAFNANTDPSITRKGVAVLTTGIWWYRKGPHPLRGGYPAFRQAEDVTVFRDGVGLDTGQFGINIHMGSLRSTSSLGCQTIYKPQWESFRSLGYAQMDFWSMKRVAYILTEMQG